VSSEVLPPFPPSVCPSQVLEDVARFCFIYLFFFYLYVHIMFG
jgi:hypothetical protein